FNLNKGKRNGKPLIDPIKSRWFNTVEFRQAVAYALDRQTMINNIYRGLGKNQDSPISVQSPYYLSPKEGLKVYNYNIEKAKQLLLKAGFKYNAQNQLLDSEGNRVRFSLLTNAGNKIREAMGSQIKQDLSKIGIQVDFTPLAWNTYLDKLSNTLDWEASMLGLTGGLEPNDGANVWNPEGGLHMFNQKPQAGQKPIEGWEVAPWEAKIGQLYIQAARELDEAKRKAIYAETQKITQENLPFIYLVNQYALSAVRDRFENIRFSALGGAFWNLYEIKMVK
ncbi:ABC transporter substrate-binding protein, partial [Nostoc sp. NIES-2111]